VFVGRSKKIWISCGQNCQGFSVRLGGSGGGDSKFGQGGGKFKDKIDEIINLAEIYVNITEIG
jgi:alanyl-tRNA synthetase